MADLKYSMLDFHDKGNKLRIVLSKRFYLEIPKDELLPITGLSVNSISFNCSKQKAEKHFLWVLNKYMPELRTIATNNPAVYVHSTGNIPLIGNLSFGLVYRDTSIIEVKPQTGCNLDCIYCSVKEGLSSRQTDYIVERDYLVNEFKKLAEFVAEPIEAHIGVQGEPLLYAEFVALVRDLSQIKNVNLISADTNGTLLSKGLIDELSKYKVRLNISLNAIDPKIASEMSGTSYNVKHVMNMVKYAANKIGILIAPLYLPGYNDNELVKVIEFAKTLPGKDYPIVGIQNFLNYKTGRNPVKAVDWNKFIDKLKELEKITGMRLILDFKKDFGIKQTNKLQKPFIKGDIIKAIIVAPGRYAGSMLASAGNRNITVFNSMHSIGSMVKLKIQRSKHNIFFAQEV